MHLSPLKLDTIIVSHTGIFHQKLCQWDASRADQIHTQETYSSGTINYQNHPFVLSIITDMNLNYMNFSIIVIYYLSLTCFNKVY